MASDPQFVVYVRLPFARGDFVDPPLVNWDAGKDKSLWKILSRNPRSSEIDWKDLASRFEVTVPFILQQAAFLYERQLSSVREQMQRIGKISDDSHDARLSPQRTERPSLDAGQQDERGSSRSNSLRARAPMSRNASSNTVTQLRPTSPASPQLQQKRLSAQNLLPRTDERAPSRSKGKMPISKAISGSQSSSADSSESEEAGPAMSRSQALLRRPPRFGKGRRPGRGAGIDGQVDEEDGEEGPAFLPDPGSTLRRPLNERSPPPPQQQQVEYSSPSASSVSSAAPVVYQQHAPQQAATAATGQRGSEGTPSMGSSFSDLDDTSVTRSALEEALASNMRRGSGFASRASSIGQALKSRRL